MGKGNTSTRSLRSENDAEDEAVAAAVVAVVHDAGDEERAAVAVLTVSQEPESSLRPFDSQMTLL